MSFFSIRARNKLEYTIKSIGDKRQKVTLLLIKLNWKIIFLSVKAKWAFHVNPTLKQTFPGVDTTQSTSPHLIPNIVSACSLQERQRQAKYAPFIFPNFPIKMYSISSKTEWERIGWSTTSRASSPRKETLKMAKTYSL